MQRLRPGPPVVAVDQPRRGARLPLERLPAAARRGQRGGGRQAARQCRRRRLSEHRHPPAGGATRLPARPRHAHLTRAQLPGAVPARVVWRARCRRHGRQVQRGRRPAAARRPLRHRLLGAAGEAGRRGRGAQGQGGGTRGPAARPRHQPAGELRGVGPRAADGHAGPPGGEAQPAAHRPPAASARARLRRPARPVAAGGGRHRHAAERCGRHGRHRRHRSHHSRHSRHRYVHSGHARVSCLTQGRDEGRDEGNTLCSEEFWPSFANVVG